MLVAPNMPVDIEIVEDRSSTTPSDKGFLKVKRLRLRTRLADGTATDPYPYDVVDRAALDAVVMLLHAPNVDAPDDPYVCVRTALRPPLILRRDRDLPVKDKNPTVELWELPAGLIEAHEKGEAGVRSCAARETHEETGFELGADAFEHLGVPVYLSPGLCAEKIHVVSAQVPDHRATVDAKGDGVLEASSRVEWWPLSRCLQRAAEGVLEDAKTELALLRFQSRLARKA